MSQSLEELIEEILQSRKYREMQIHADTVRDILEKELRQARSQKEAVKAARQKLHNIIAPYLGDPDYPAACRSLDEAFAGGDPASVKAVCRQILAQHASTRERLPLLEQGFYQEIFAMTGRSPGVILDLACGLNPLAFPWMDLPPVTHYHAYDIHGPRVELINHFFSLQGLAPLAETRDVLVHPPETAGEVAFIFKEAHRMEQRQRGCSAPLWNALRVRFLAVSLPAHSLSGRFDLVERQRKLVAGIVGNQPWQVAERILGDEMVFVIDKGGETG